VKKISIKVKNPPDEIQGLHFFAQCLDELLSDDSDDSYKAPALNLVTRLMELNILANDVQLSEISADSIRPFLEELEWGLNIDPVISEEEKDLALTGLKRLLTGSPSPKRIAPYADWVLDSLANYFVRLKEQIQKNILDGNKKEMLRALAISLSAYIEVEGFSRRFAYQHVQRKLIKVLNTNKTIDIQKVINKFLNRFDRDSAEATVYYKGSKDFITFSPYTPDWQIEILEEVPEHDSKDTAHIDFFTKDENTVFVAINSVTARDPYAARDKAESQLNSFASAIRYHCHESLLQFSENCVVKTSIDGRSIFSIIGVKPNPMLCGEKIDVNPQVISRLTHLIAGHHLTESSTRKYKNALTYHRGALRAPLFQNQLVALWSALEGLLPNPESSEVRIKYFVEIVTSVLVLSYPQNLFKVLAQQLQENCDAATIKIVDGLEGGNWTNKVMAMVCCEEYDDQRRNVASKLDANPLLRYRMKELYDSFSSAGKINRTLQRHKNKVAWHLSRIYWNRNLIVHSAESMPYLMTIVENLHDYLDTVMNGISYYASKSASETSIESVVQAILTDAEFRMTSLSNISKKQDAPCKLDNYVEFIIGRNNVFAAME
jgi:hypothetical protein